MADKIIILNTLLEPAGAQKASSTLSKLLHNKGIPNKLIFIYRKKHFDYLDNFNIDHKILLDKNRVKIYELPKIFFLILKENPGIIFAFTHYSIVISILLKIYRRKIKIVACHRNPFRSYPLIVKLVLNLCYSLVDETTFVSDDTKKSFFPKDGHTIKNPIGYYKANHTTTELKTNNKFVLCVGRLDKQKNYIELLQDLTLYNGNLKLLIVGEGPQKNEIIDFINKYNLNNVILTGNLSHSEVIQLLKNSECFIMPSKFEGTSNSLVEALYFSKAVAINNIPSLVETATYNGNVHALVKGKNFDNWADLFLGIDKRRYRLKTKEISKKFNNNTLLQGYLDIINSFK